MTTTTAQTFDFDAALSDAFEDYDRKSRVLSDQEQHVARLQSELWQAERVADELRREWDATGQEVESLAEYTGWQPDAGYEHFTPLEFD